MPFDGISSAAPVTVRLHGRLKRFGARREMAVLTAAEAIRALALLQPGFRGAMAVGEYRVVRGRLKDGIDLEPISLHLRLAPGSEIHVIPVPAGAGGQGGGGKAILGAVIMVAAIAASPFTMGGSLGFAAAMGTTTLGGLTTFGNIFMMGAAMFLTGISQMLSPQPKTPTRVNANDDRSFLLSGTSNVVEQGTPVPLAYGFVRVGTVVASIGYSAEEYNPAPAVVPDGNPEPESAETPGYFEQPAVEQVVEGGGAGGGGGGAKGGGGGGHVAREAPNNLRSRAVVRIIDVLSEGPIEGLANGAQSIYFNNTPLQASDGSWNFKGISWEVRTGQPDQNPISGYPAAEQSQPVGMQVKQASPVTQTITSATATACRVTVRIPALFLQDTEKGDVNPGPTLEYKVEVRPVAGAWTQVVTEMITGGKCMSPYERSYRFDLPVSGSSSWDIRMTRITADSTASSEASDTWWSALDIITDHQLIYPDTAYIALTIDSEAFGAQLPQRSYEIKGIQCRVPLNYDPVARTYATTGVGTSGGTWDGASWKLAWTSNNAWVLYDLLSNPRYGVGLSSSALSNTKWDLYAIAQYCDALVDDGFGGQEPRYQMNAVVVDQEDAYRLLQKFVGSFRGLFYWAAGSLAVAADMPAEPVKLLTQANVLDGQFAYESSSLATRHNAARVAWRDPNGSWAGAVEMVEDYATNYLSGQRVADVVGFGVTSRGLANRLGRWLIDTENNTPEMANFAVAIENMDLRPGDVVSVADRYYAGIRMGGRLVAGTTTTLLKLDALFTTQVGQTYTISVILPDGTVVNNHAISSWGTSGGLTTVTVAALAQAPAAGTPFLITSSALAPRQFRVAGIAEVERGRFGVVALQHDPNKYSRVESGVALPSPVFSTLQDQVSDPLPRLGERVYTVSTSGGSATLTGVDTVGLQVGMLVAAGEPYPAETAIQSINSLAGSVVLTANRTGVGAFTGPMKFVVISAQSYLTGVGNTTTVRTTVSWSQPTDIRIDRVDVRVFTAEALLGFYNAVGASVDIDNLPAGSYRFGVRPVGRDGRSGSWVDSHLITVAGTSLAPPAVTGLGAIGGTRRIEVSWTKVPTRDLKHYEIWRKIGGGTPGGDPVVAGGAFLRFSNATSETDNDGGTLLPNTQGWYWVRAISTTDVVGPWAGPVGATTTLLVTADLQDAILTAAKFASTVKPVEIIANTGVAAANGVYAVSQADGKLYYRVGGVWVQVANAGDLSGQITSSQIADLAVTTAKIAALAVTSAQVAAAAITAEKLANGSVLSVAQGASAVANWVWNPCGAISTDGWAALGAVGTVAVAATADPSWSLAGQGSLLARPNADMATNVYFEIGWRPSGSSPIGVPIRAGDKVALQAEVLPKNGLETRLVAYWYDAAGAPTLALYSSAIATSSASDGNTLENYTRLSAVIGPAPAEAVRVDLRVRAANNTGATITLATNPLVAVTRVGIGPAGANATEVAPWSPGAATELPGGMVRAGTVTNAQLAANAVATANIQTNAITSTLIAPGSITTPKLAANAVTANEILAGAVTTAKLAAAAVTANEIAAGAIRAAQLGIGLPSNVIWNSCPGLAVDGWLAPFASTGGMSPALSAVLGTAYDPDWVLPGYAGLALAGTSMPNNAYIETAWRPDGAIAGSMPVVPGDVVEIQGALIASANLTAIIYIIWTDEAGGSLGLGAYTVAASVASTDGKSLAKYASPWGKATAPANAAAARLVLRLQNLSGSTQTGFLIGTRFSIGLGQANAVAAMPWAPGGTTQISGGVIRTGTLDTRTIAAGAITAAKIAANTITAAQIAAGTITATEIAAATINAGNIAALAITASKLAITGGSVLPDTSFDDTASFWAVDASGFVLENASGSNTAATLGVRRAAVLASPGFTNTVQKGISSIAFGSCAAGQIYRLRARGSNTNTTRALAVQLYAVDSTGAQVGGGGGIAQISWLNETAANKATQFTVPAGGIRLVVGVVMPSGAAWSGTAAVGDVTVVQAATGDLLVDGAITAGKIAAGAITTTELAADSVTAAKIAAGAIGASEIAANVISAAHLAATTLITSAAQMGTAVIEAAQIASGAITNAKIGNLEVDSAKIANLTVGSGKLAYNAATRVAEAHNFSDVNYPGGRSPSGGQAACYFNTTIQVETNGTVIVFLRVALKATATGSGGAGGAGEGGAGE